ncbi:endonuclease/exonuclease/phosphatase family protein [Oceanirhabdus sp. W0125-5]|uniref:endonuclease/exonuclease/phosphatase family protein n=1 Tax=Oceanirhabdus sp. W0125-5 TaxID=2999116 RepID=UPI0022F2DF89|nr:endonuclease/exonuclease/phosphatase family protein [Oceanirhabdus sp. W0125-5]WBW98071.1 endonuclease/exonuclease/phosphatase family protein [Oceanirhabdus sp. W0125-5]
MKEMLIPILIKIFLIFTGLLLALFIIFTVLVDYNPQDVMTIKINHGASKKEVSIDEELTIVSYNIGYGGTDKSQDFYMCGGKGTSVVEKSTVNKNIKHILEQINNINSDILLIQEVDSDSKRSAYMDQIQIIRDKFKEMDYVSAFTHKSGFVPVPIKEPMGKIESSIMTFSKYNIEESKRYKLPDNIKWPTKGFKHDRAMLESVLLTKNGKKLVVLNIHLSAFDEDAKIRREQLEFINEHIKTYLNRGDYLIIGGDFNLILNSVNIKFNSKEKKPDRFEYFPEEVLLQQTQLIFDDSSPTARSLSRPYDENSFKAVVDGFIISNNIEVIQVENLEYDFKYSDHNPVVMKFKLK